jgi:hypothetical protein
MTIRCFSSRAAKALFIVFTFWAGAMVGASADEYSRLQDLAVAAQKAPAADKTELWKHFLSESLSFAEANSQNLEIWELRAAAAIATNDEIAGKEAARKLTALNALASRDNTVRAVMANLVMNGWLAVPGPPQPEASPAKTPPPTIEQTVDYLRALLKRAALTIVKEDSHLDATFELVGYNPEAKEITVKKVGKVKKSSGANTEFAYTAIVPIEAIQGIENHGLYCIINSLGKQISVHEESTFYYGKHEPDKTTIDSKSDSMIIAFPDSIDVERAVKAFTHLWKLVRGPELFDE